MASLPIIFEGGVEDVSILVFRLLPLSFFPEYVNPIGISTVEQLAF